MKKSRFTDEQIIGFIKQAEGGMPLKELCRLGGFSGASFYKWRAKFGGMQASEATRLREIESAKLKKPLPGWFRNYPSVSAAAPVAMQACPEPATGSRPA